MTKFRNLTTLLFTLTFFGIASCNSESDEKEKPSVKKTENQLYEVSWSASTDTVGSFYKPQKVVVKDSAVTVDFYREPKSEVKNTWIELIASIGKKLTGTDSLKITYKCDKPLIIKLSQEDFGSNGNETYSHYQHVVSACDNYSTIVVKIKDFEQPDWTPDESKGIDLNLDNVKKIYLTPDVEESSGGKASLSIKSILLYQK